MFGIIAAMVSGIARLGDIRQPGSLGSRTQGHYIGTTALVIITGIVSGAQSNLPVEGIALLLAIDWFLDRGRTTVNVCGNRVGAEIIDRKVKRSVTGFYPIFVVIKSFTPDNSYLCQRDTIPLKNDMTGVQNDDFRGKIYPIKRSRNSETGAWDMVYQ